jgi:hypothetical protein
MASLPIRDQEKDHLLTPKNCALAVIDYQPVQVNSIVSMDRQRLVNNIVAVARIAKAYGVPIVVTTVNVKTGINKPLISQLRQVFGDLPTYDRTTINAWEDKEFQAAVKATGRKKLIMTALWTEACRCPPCRPGAFLSTKGRFEMGPGEIPSLPSPAVSIAPIFSG